MSTSSWGTTRKVMRGSRKMKAENSDSSRIMGEIRDVVG